MAAEKTTTPTFTPGPWSIAPYAHGDETVNVVANYEEINEPGCRVQRGDWIAELDAGLDFDSDDDAALDRMYANAHLIAAAPDLYEALRDMREAVAAMLRVIAMHPGTIAEEFGEEIQRAGVAVGFGTRAQHAIAKAEGREP